MVWRKWAVRGLVFAVLGGVVFLVVAYQFWTSPDAIRGHVLARLNHDFANVHTSIDSAKLRLFGGISITELRMARRDDLDKSDFLYIPSAILYHDKEQLLKSKLTIRKVELQRPRLRVVRERDGRWNLAGLMGQSDGSQQMPTLVVKQGTLVLEDRQAAPGTPPLEIKNVYLTAVNDPLPVIAFEGGGTCDCVGAVRLRGKATRGGPVTCSIEMTAFSVGPDLVQRIAGYCPDTAAHLRQLSGKGKLDASLTWDPRATPRLQYSVHGEITDGQFAHARLPRPLEKIHGSFDCSGGVLGNIELHASAGPIGVSVVARDVSLDPDQMQNWPALVRELDVDVRHVPVNKDLFRYLPPNMEELQQQYSPEGNVSAHLSSRRTDQGGWRRKWLLTAEDVRGTFHAFQYPAEKVRGTIEMVTTGSLPPLPGYAGAEPPPEESKITVDLTGQANGRPFSVTGVIEGPRGSSAVRIDLSADGIPIDETLLGALQPRTRALVLPYHATGVVDVRLAARRARGDTRMSNRYVVRMRDGTVCYDVFPLPLKDVSATLELFPDHWELRDFIGRHGDGVMRISGRSHPLPEPDPLPGPRNPRFTSPLAIREVSYSSPASPDPLSARPERISLSVQGDNLALDDSFRSALAPGRDPLVRVWDTFALAGRMNFAAHIDQLPNQPQDVDVTVSVGGCRMNPTFFRYPLDDVSATVRYARGTIVVTDFRGRHGNASLGVDRAVVHLKRGGGFWARLDTLRGTPLVPNAEFLRALPPALRKATEGLRLQQPVRLEAVVILDQPPEAGLRPVVYWDGTLRMDNVSLRAGTDVTGVTGAISCRGLHNGQQLEDVVGNVHLERATVLGQPIQNLHFPVEVWKNSPDILRIPHLRAEMFGGTVGGEARVEFGSIFRYELLLRTSGVQLERLGQHNFGKTAELSGQATAGLHLIGEGTDLTGLKGAGRIDVPSGKLYRLPLFLDLIKWLGLRLPDRTAFEQAMAEFRFEGNRLTVNRLELYGNAISLRGQGSLNLDGTDLNLDLNGDWGRMYQLLPSGINDLSRQINDQLLRIKVRGRVGKAEFQKELVPVVTAPLKRVWNTVWPTGSKKGADDEK